MLAFLGGARHSRRRDSSRATATGAAIAIGEHSGVISGRRRRTRTGSTSRCDFPTWRRCRRSSRGCGGCSISPPIPTRSARIWRWTRRWRRWSRRGRACACPAHGTASNSRCARSSASRSRFRRRPDCSAGWCRRMARRLPRRSGTARVSRHLFPSPTRDRGRRSRRHSACPSARARAVIVAGGGDLPPIPRSSAAAPASSEAIAKLRALPGIGEWTAQYIAMRELREPDAFPGRRCRLAARDGGCRRPPAVAGRIARARRALAAMARLRGAASVGRRCRLPPCRRRKPMRAKPPETSRSIGWKRRSAPALVVTDADGMLRAFDWEDHAARVRELLRLQYGAVDLKEARAPGAIRSALSGYFKGELDALNDDRMAHRRHAVPAKGLERAAENPGGHDHELWRAGDKARHRRRRCARSAMPMARTRSASSFPAIA